MADRDRTSSSRTSTEALAVRPMSNAERRRKRHEEELRLMESSGDSSFKPQLEGIKKIYRDTDQEEVECAVCLLPSLYPTVLPCGHIFCYLCIKGAVRTGSKTCPMCRSEIPADMLFKPVLYEPLPTQPSGSSSIDSFQFKWFYQRRRASGEWWQYDDRTSDEIEEAFKSGQKTLELLICGEIYVIDFESKYQFQKIDPTKRRRIIRNTKKDIQVIGVSGINKTEN